MQRPLLLPWVLQLLVLPLRQGPGHQVVGLHVQQVLDFQAQGTLALAVLAVETVQAGVVDRPEQEGEPGFTHQLPCLRPGSRQQRPAQQ